MAAYDHRKRSLLTIGFPGLTAPMTADVHNLVTLKNIGAAKGLLQSLVPRAQCFCFYDTTRSCIWSSDGVEDHEIDNFVADLTDAVVTGSDRDADILRRTVNSGRTLLALPVYAGDGEGLGILISVFSKNAGKSSWFNPSLLKNILLPAVQVIGETLRLNHELERSRRNRHGVDKELQLIYQIDKKIHGTSRSHASLAQLVGQSGRFLGIAYSVLLMPAKRIRISATHATWKGVERKSVDKYLLDKLFVELEGYRAPAVFEIPEVSGSSNPAEKGIQALLCPLIDSSGNLEGVLAQFGRVNGRSFSKRHIRFMSHIVRKVEYVIEQSFDSMTGLMNRTGFEAQLRESRNSLDDKDDAHHLIYFDLDNLQLVNDTFGRQAGDEVIMRFAQLVGEHLPQNAVATRLTGDDFVILLAHSSVEDALKLTGEIRGDSQVLRYLQGDKSLQVTISAGISSLDMRHGEADALTTARIACDAAKDHGRDSVEVYDQDNQSIIQRYDDMYLVSEIQNSLDADEIKLLAQPIVPLNSGVNTRRYEILLRMKDKQGNRVSSGAFFSAAERYQLMPQVDRWVVSHTLAGLSPVADILASNGVSFAINLSGQSLGDPDLLKFIEDEISNSGVPPHCICFEVTESAAVSSRNRAQAFINALRKRGCSFSLDDFGAGLSSFAYLKNFAVDTLKIDGGFVRDITNNRISESMVAAITQVAKVMELETVAEYVETAETKKLVRELGVDYAQGHAVGKPIPFEKVIDTITIRSAASSA